MNKLENKKSPNNNTDEAFSSGSIYGEWLAWVLFVLAMVVGLAVLGWEVFCIVTGQPIL